MTEAKVIVTVGEHYRIKEKELTALERLAEADAGGYWADAQASVLGSITLDNDLLPDATRTKIEHILSLIRPS